MRRSSSADSGLGHHREKESAKQNDTDSWQQSELELGHRRPSQLNYSTYNHLFPLVTQEDVYEFSSQDAEALFYAHLEKSRRQSSNELEKRRKKKKVSFDFEYDRGGLELQEVAGRDTTRRASGNGHRLSLDGQAHGPTFGQARRISAPNGNEYGSTFGQSRRVSVSHRRNLCFSFSDDEMDEHRGSILSEDSAYNTIESIRMSSLTPPATSPTLSPSISPYTSLTPLSKANVQSNDSANSTIESIRMSSLTSPSTSPNTSPYASLNGVRHLENIVEEDAAAEQKNRRSMMPLNAANLYWLQQLHAAGPATKF